MALIPDHSYSISQPCPHVPLLIYRLFWRRKYKEALASVSMFSGPLASVRALYCFQLNLLGRQWLVRLSRFHVYISVIHDLYFALCTH